MSSQEFWEDDPQIYWAYRIFYIKKMQDKAKEVDYNCWLQGSYNFNAFSTALINAFSKKKVEYIKRPLLSNKAQANTELDEKLKDIKDRDVKIQTEFNYWARM